MTKEEKEKYLGYLRDKHLAPLPLDNKWHQLFPNGKPSDIAAAEQEVDALVKREGMLHTELKELKRMKEHLMKEIVSNMDVESDVKKLKVMEDSQRQIIEINARTAEYEDELLEMPKRLQDANKELMLLTMDYCYTKLHTYQKEIDTLEEWIKKVRIELKKNILRKQDRETRNKQMYMYMHDVFGPSVCNIFDYEEENQSQE